MTVEQFKAGVIARKRWVLAALVVLVAAVGLSVALRGQRGDSGNYVLAPVSKGAIRNVVAATGNVEAVVTVQVGSQVSGQIKALYADYNSVVKRGQLLTQIDPRNFQAQVQNAQASLASAEAHVQTAQADILTQQANLDSAKANVDAATAASANSTLIVKRDAALVQKGILDQNTYDTAKTTADSDAAKVEQAKAAVKQAAAQITADQATLEQAKAQVLQAKAQLDQAKVSLEYCDIYSPVDGVVISRSVDVGQTVAASFSAPLLFTIANDLTKMQVDASVDEADIGQISTSDPVTFTVDAYPNQVFNGRIQEVRLNSQAVQNVVTYSVIIGVDNTDLRLKPGMTANISMTAEHREDVLKVANAALRFRPSDVTPAEEARLLRGGAGGPGGAAEGGRGAGRRGGSRATEGQIAENGGAPAASPQGAGPSGERGQRGFGNRAGTQSAGAAGHNAPAAANTTTLAPGQLWDPNDKIHFPQAAPPRGRPALVWVVGDDGKPKSVRVMIGITDGANTQIMSGDLHEGEQVIIGDMSGGGRGQQRGGRGGFGGGFRF
ncbi:MAG TPA: efflux RND transporter periplasmic adaptor subunit [Vicinamibacterales bacterium]|jgi:HlyD family secretion protein